MEAKGYAGQDCSLARALEVIGERWTLLIIRDAFYGVRHFNDFRAHLDIPKAVLSGRLAGLVGEGILDRRTDPGHAGRHLYELTPAGRDLWPAVHALLTWGSQHRAPNRMRFSTQPAKPNSTVAALARLASSHRHPLRSSPFLLPEATAAVRTPSRSSCGPPIPCCSP